MRKIFVLTLIAMVLAGCAGFGNNGANDSNSQWFTSNYFKDSTQKFGINENTILNWTRGISKDKFDYKVLSALQMLGYSFELNKGDRRAPNVVVLERFKRDNGIGIDDDPNREQVTKETLLALDKQMKEQEQKDAVLAQRFSLYPNTVTDHPNGVTKEFVSAIVVKSLEALPSNLVDLGRRNMLQCEVSQCTGGIAPGSFIFQKGTDTPIRSVPQDDNFDFYNVRFLGKKDEQSASGGFSLGTEILVTIHEYGHYLDGSIYAPLAGTKQGMIDTREFYKISYEGVDALGSPPFYFKHHLLYLKEGLNESAFVDNYGMAREGNDKQGKMQYRYVEDFAESFATYVASGKDFRKKAENNEILKRKYDWLKQNVFNEIEYDTDLPRISGNYDYRFGGELKRLE